MKKRVNLKNRVSALVMSFFLALGLMTPAFSITANAEAIEVLESSATIADCVMSYYAMTGSAVANTDWINTLYNSLGSSFGTIGSFAEQGLMTYVDGVWQPVEQLTQNIANTSAYTNLGLDTVFSVSAEEAAAGGGLTAASGAATLSGAVGCVATHGILPVLGGVTASYWGGIALGTIIAHKLGLYDQNIYMGVEMDFNTLKENIPSGSRCCYIKEHYSSTSDYIRYVFGDGISYSYVSGNDFYYGICSKTGGSIPMYRYSVNLSTGRITGANELQTNIITRATSVDKVFDNNILNKFNSESAFRAKWEEWKAGTDEPLTPVSPDLIGSDGNLSGNYENGNYSVPDMKPEIDPQTQSGKPLSLEDWLQFANGVQNNNNSTSPVPNNTSLFQDILDAIKSVVPTPTPTPDPNPGGETYPVPGPNPDPSPVPDPDYQPETKPQPEYTEKATENETDITEGDPWTTPDLLDKFPFCIPRDVYRVFTKLDSGARSAPHIQWRFNPNNKIDYTFDIDFSEWDAVATLLRTLELLGFIVALAVATRKMILS